MTTIQQLQRLHRASGLTIQAVADKIGMTRQQLSAILNGKHDPSTETLEKIVSALGAEIKILTAPEGV